MRPIRIACVRYLNTAPLIHGLEKLDGCEVIPTVPSRIAGMVQTGEADIGLASVIDAARSGLALLPVGMIGCDGPTLTVRVFSSVPLDRIVELHADTDSHTSVVLCQLLLKRLFGVRPNLIDFDARERMELGGLRTKVEAAEDTQATDLDCAWPQTVLLIGDKVVTDAPPASRYPHQLDLGEAWKGLTGLPFVYAMWMCRADRATEQSIVGAAALLDRQRRHNRTRLDWIVSVAAAEHRWPAELAAKYLGSLLRYNVGVPERNAVELFLSMAATDGLIAAASPTWVEFDSVGAA